MGEDTLERQITRAVLAAIEAHERHRHTMSPDEVSKLLREHVKLVKDMGLLVTDIHGKRDGTAANPDRRTGGIVVKVDEMHDKLTNGGVQAKLPTVVTVAIITTAGLVLVAFITGVFTYLTGGV